MSDKYLGSEKGLTVLSSDNQSVTYITSSYTSGILSGDIKGAWLADTDATNITGSELVTNGTFTSNITGWTAGSSTLSVASSRLRITADGGTKGGASQSFTTVVGKTYTVSVYGLDGTTSPQYRIGTSQWGTQYLGDTTIPTGVTAQFTFVATSTITWIGLVTLGTSAGVYADFDNVSVRLADSDRSVNNNGLQVFGTITKTPVATGAELVAYSGFSATNYLEQPYNADLNYGTGAFYIRGWVNLSANTTALLFDRGDATQERIAIANNSGTGLSFQVRDSAGTASSVSMSANLPLSVFKMFTAVRDSSGTILSIYLDDTLEVSATVTARNVDSTDQGLTIGAAHIDKSVSLSSGSLVIMQTGAGAPTAEQIKAIYESERHLFQDNAACTLDGTSDAVQALAYDEDTQLLHASTSQYRSVFKGLQRVESEAGNFTSLSAVNGVVANGN